MIDEFRPDNGATRFVPGSQRWSAPREDTLSDLRAEHDAQVLACAGAGSLLVFNGSTWHGHTANTSDGPRRSLQGAFIPRDGRAWTDFTARMQPETCARLSPLARYVLALFVKEHISGRQYPDHSRRQSSCRDRAVGHCA